MHLNDNWFIQYSHSTLYTLTNTDTLVMHKVFFTAELSTSPFWKS